MLLDLDEGTLAVWINGESKGIVIQQGMSYRKRDRVRRSDIVATVHPLRGPLKWAMELGRGYSVAIETTATSSPAQV